MEETHHSALERGHAGELLTPISPEEYFQQTPAPPNAEQVKREVEEFVSHHVAQHGRVVLITSGGTTVPFEKNTVRFLDNFSRGGRGSSSAEYFLQQGYGVVFLHRAHSLQPFSRQFMLERPTSQVQHPLTFLDYVSLAPDGSIQVVPEHREQLTSVLKKYKEAVGEGRLLNVPFVTIHEYLWLLRICTEALAPCGKSALVYAAAAVSDFYIPVNLMAEHKIQSSEGSLVVHFRPVPKMLKPLVHQWCPNAFVVTFKLETQADLLNRKVHSSFGFGQQVVVGNMLSSHKDEVWIHSATEEEGHHIFRTAQDQAAGKDIEEQLVNDLVARHERFLLS